MAEAVEPPRFSLTFSSRRRIEKRRVSYAAAYTVGMAEPLWPLIEWEALYGVTYSLTNDSDTLEYLWSYRFSAGIIRAYLSNVERWIDRRPYRTSNDWQILRLRWSQN